MLDTSRCCVCTGRSGSALPRCSCTDTGSAGTLLVVGGVVAVVAAPDTDHRVGDKMPVAASDADGAPDSQLSIVGDQEGAEG